MGRRFLCCCLLLAFVSATLAQQGTITTQTAGQPQTPTDPHDPGLVIRPLESPGSRDSAGRKIRHIDLNVVVTDASGRPVRGLTQDDFTLLDNQQPVKISAFEAVQPGESRTTAVRRTASPAQVILLLDTVNNSFEGVAAERQEMEKFFAQNGGKLPVPVSIIIFSDAGAKVGQPTRDGNLLISDLRKANTAIRTIDPAMGGEGYIERLQLSLRGLTQLTAYEATQPGRKLLLWLGPGWPTLEGVQFGQPSAKYKHADWDGIVSFSTDLREAHISLYSIGSPLAGMEVGRATFYQAFLKPVRSAKEADSGNLATQVLAIQSGGLVSTGTNDLASEIAKCLTEAQDFYKVSFDILPSATVNEYHSLQVKIDKPGLVARTNSGYYGQP